MILYLKFMIYEQLGSVGELVLYGEIEAIHSVLFQLWTFEGASLKES